MPSTQRTARHVQQASFDFSFSRPEPAKINPLRKLEFYEFFAGGGMARIGLGSQWTCRFANDWSDKKAKSYKENFPDEETYVCRDVNHMKSCDLPGMPDLVWASFPCQDLSLAGPRQGLNGKRSGTFWPFWRLVQRLANEGRPPRLVVLENVVGAITSHKYHDFITLCQTIATAGYRVGALVVDAAHFVPQSRPRLFIIAALEMLTLPESVQSLVPTEPWHPKKLREAEVQLPKNVSRKWVWWRLPEPLVRSCTLLDLMLNDPSDVEYFNKAQVSKLLSQMSPANLDKLEEAKKSGKLAVGGVYRRTRSENGKKVQRAEVRFDGVSGCLRTPGGGSSRQIMMFVKGESIKVRLLSTREAARLMGVPDDYKLPSNYNIGYHLMGDGLVVPAVSWIEKHILRPIMAEAL